MELYVDGGPLVVLLFSSNAENAALFKKDLREAASLTQ